jgi:PIN domain nuclease of toxin-antitoxin system
MKILLDTNILLRSASGELPPEAQKYIEDSANALFFSPASIWEIVVKHGLGRSNFTVDPVFLYNGLLKAGYQELPVTGRHTLLVQTLPSLHKDPFDRILLAQAVSEGLTFLTTDKVLLQYPGSIIYIPLSDGK